ncbi:Sir2 family NAD+-dependent deacetylase [Marinicella litoralis]|uniref:NAD-dependent protein deacylase n=1 Tax=Marinicella litoralis TaxID=644220 RepID=A0A4R6XGV3_9GAMM|nr:Sir2 family NAD+-dependent deacetylase [Marinicella litoralis]TDR16323.1 NAD-dependent deacetylase [Marinicella litoralis]
MYKKTVVLTGAGVSAESGLSTFRDNNGLWDNHRVEDVATPEAFDRNPELVHQFYNQRRAALSTVVPNTAHMALAKVENRSESFLLVTQNVDDLHHRAGSENLLHMHGELLKKRCVQCHEISSQQSDLTLESICGHCERVGTLRPHIVWFGEMPLYMDEIMLALMQCDLFVSIGTSGTVYPAAGFVEIANQSGAHTVELNLEPSDQNSQFQQSIHGPASQVVPKFFESIELI